MVRADWHDGGDDQAEEVIKYFQVGVSRDAEARKSTDRETPLLHARMHVGAKWQRVPWCHRRGTAPTMFFRLMPVFN